MDQQEQITVAAEPSSKPEKKSAKSMPKVPEKPEKAVPRYPFWWRSTWKPFVVLLLAAAVGDLLAPRGSTLQGGEVVFGLGPAVGGILLIMAMMLLRRDLNRSEMFFMGALGLSCGLALAVSGSMLCWMMVWMLPLFFVALSSTEYTGDEPGVRFHNWWSFWFTSQHAHRLSFLARFLPWLISALIGGVLFILFLCIFASGNPVVELIWNSITDMWNRLVSFLRIDWDFGLHVLLWVLGVLWFGIYTLRRPRASSSSAQPTEAPAPGRSILPQLPLMVLLGINLSFMIVNASDMAYLWFRRVPEGVSQTAYLHEGASSIIWASVIASAILIFLFRASGSARRGGLTRSLGYLLVGQTILLAGSVFIRLYYQIDEYGFTVRRLVAGEMMLFGVLGLVVLLGYMVSGRFLRSLWRGLAAAVVLLALTQVNPPSSLAGDLNMTFRMLGEDDAAPARGTSRRSFAPSDFYRHVPMSHNLTFALYTYDHLKHRFSAEERADFLSRMESVALNVECRASRKGWFLLNWMTQRDIPAAERILGRPIRSHEVRQSH